MSLGVLLSLGPSPVLGQMEPVPKPQPVVQMGHTGSVLSVAVSPDGKYLATGSEDHTSKLWDLTSGQEIRTFHGHRRQVNSVAFSPDGIYLATGSEDNTAKLWDLATGLEVRTFRGHRGIVNFVAFTADGKHLATGSGDQTVKLWDMTTGKEIRTYGGQQRSGTFFAFSPDGKCLAMGDSDKTYLMDLATGQEIRDLATGQEVGSPSGRSGIFLSMGFVAFSIDSRHIVTGVGGTAKLWDIATGLEVRNFKGHAGQIVSGAVSPDGKYLATGSIGHDAKWAPGNTAKLWELATGQEIKNLGGHPAGVGSVAFSPDGKYLVTGSFDCTAKLWDVSTGQEIRTFKGQRGRVISIAFSRDGRYLATGGGDDTPRLWDLAVGQEVRAFKEHPGGVISIAFSPDGRFLGTGGLIGATKLWNLATGQEIWNFHDRGVDPVYIAFSPDGKSLFTGGRGHPISLLDLAKGQEIRTFKGQQITVTSIAVSPDGKFLATGGLDQTANLWDLAAGREIRAFEGHANFVSSIAISPDGKYLATGSGDHSAKLWDLATGQESRAFGGHRDALDSVAFSPDGKYLATASQDNTSRLWDLAGGRELWTFKGHESGVRVVAFSPNGKYLATGSADGTTRIWDIGTGKELCRLISVDSDWVVLTPEGYFDGSPEGMKSIRWTVGLESYPLDAFSEGYYVPGLLARILSGQAVAIGGQPSLSNGFGLPPAVKIVSPGAGATIPTETVDVSVVATDQGGGIDEIRFFHNDKIVGGTARDIKVVGKGRHGERSKIFQVRLLEGDNRFRAVAFSRDRIEGRPDEIAVVYRGPAQLASLHVLSVGISRYKNPALDLSYARPDAAAISEFFASAPRRLFSEAHTQGLYDAQATKAAIMAKLDGLKETRPQDVVVIYLAGHGEAVGNSWFFVPHELIYPERDEELKARALSSAELQSAVKEIGAQKVLLMIDACKSGGALLAFAARGLEERKAISLLARATGVHVVAASSKEQVASEVRELGHGVFTYTVLDALRGRADASPKDGVVTVRELLVHLEDRLPEISEKYRTQPQYPVIDSRGMDFPLAPAR